MTMTTRSALNNSLREFRWYSKAITGLSTLGMLGLTALFTFDQKPSPPRASSPSLNSRFPSQKRPSALPPAAVLIHHEQVNTEQAVWSGAFQWMAQNRLVWGRCTVQPEGPQFKVKCMSSASPGGMASAVPPASIHISNALFKPSTVVQSMAANALNATNTTDIDVHAQAQRSGWIQTREGLRQYDARHETWLAPKHRP
ncbi:hypothetical protein NQT62_13485 [Limnobacter humi]|uniref:Uncharacterized protein n=1 Tax=Limnobacter humi TaxID=1778671 RepID=A0ABT1WIX4_9BURK|nr:hypothetical protein [Limnobacter humi]MCQ8897448.1 hypothetical protein [Limnobacter humi]